MKRDKTDHQCINCLIQFNNNKFKQKVAKLTCTILDQNPKTFSRTAIESLYNNLEPSKNKIPKKEMKNVFKFTRMINTKKGTYKNTTLLLRNLRSQFQNNPTQSSSLHITDF